MNVHVSIFDHPYWYLAYVTDLDERVIFDVAAGDEENYDFCPDADTRTALYGMLVDWLVKHDHTVTQTDVDRPAHLWDNLEREIAHAEAYRKAGPTAFF